MKINEKATMRGLYERRKRKDLSLEKMAQKLGTTMRTVSRWEKSAIPTIKWLVKLGDFYEVPFQDLIILEDE